MNKSLKELFIAAKLYNKYLLTVKTKLDHSQLNAKIDMQNFKTNIEIADRVFDEIKNEWFFLSNNDTIKHFRLKSVNIEQNRLKFNENYQILEYIAKLYGFDLWYATAKYKLSSSSSSTNILLNK